MTGLRYGSLRAVEMPRVSSQTKLGLRDDAQTETLSRGELLPKGAVWQVPRDLLMSLTESHATYKVPAN